MPSGAHRPVCLRLCGSNWNWMVRVISWSCCRIGNNDSSNVTNNTTNNSQHLRGGTTMWYLGTKSLNALNLH